MADITTEDAALLFELQRLWHDRYRIEITDDGTWLAERITGGSPITAPTGPKIRHLITQDAIAWNHSEYARNNR